MDSPFEQFIESLPDAVIGVSQGGKIVLANRQAGELFRYDPDQLVGLPLDALVPDRFAHAHGRHRQGYFGDPRTRPMGVRLRLAGKRRDGSEFPAEISLSSTRTDEGVIAWAAVRDITERLEAEREREQMRREAREVQAQRLESLGQLAGAAASRR